MEHNCNNEISYLNWRNGTGRCKSCAGSINMRKRWENREYKERVGQAISRGNKGREFTEEHCKNLKIAHIGKNLGRDSSNFGKPLRPHWGIYKGILMRSNWEIWFAQFLDISGYRWEYESKTFDLGSTTYTPDFYVPEWNQFIEIKGYFSQKAKDKIDLFKEQYPKENLRIFQRENLKRIGVII